MYDFLITHSYGNIRNLKKIVAIPRPSVYENSAKKCFIELVAPYVDNYCEDILGNVIVKKYGKTQISPSIPMFV